MLVLMIVVVVAVAVVVVIGTVGLHPYMMPVTDTTMSLRA